MVKPILDEEKAWKLLQANGVDIKPEQFVNIAEAANVLNQMIGSCWFFQNITVELYESGKIKKIEKKGNPLMILAAGISLGIVIAIAGVAIYFIGPPLVVKALGIISKCFVVV